MRKLFLILGVGLFLTHFCTSTGQAEENKKLAQTGFQFLSVASDARATAMANAVNSLEFGSAALFFNPAGMANMPQFIDLSLSNNKWIADINHNTFSVAISPWRGKYGVVGVSVQTVDYGELQGTVVADNSLGYIDTGTFSPSAMAIGVGYARALSDRFAVGGQVRWVRQELGEATIPETDTTTTRVDNRLTPFSFDFGTLYKTGFKSLTFGMSVRNFSQEIKYEEEGFQLPLVFTLGVSMNVLELMPFKGPQQALILSIDATHYRSHPEQLLFGLDYRLLNLVSLRGGYVVGNEEDNLTFGFGFSQFGIVFDYAYTPFHSFANVQRITARFSF